jgi:hypothetical protein
VLTVAVAAASPPSCELQKTPRRHDGSTTTTKFYKENLVSVDPVVFVVVLFL